MQCSNCGRVNPASAVYCLDCGHKLRETANIAAPQPRAVRARGDHPGRCHPPSRQLDSMHCLRCGVDNPARGAVLHGCAATASAPPGSLATLPSPHHRQPVRLLSAAAPAASPAPFAAGRPLPSLRHQLRPLDVLLWRVRPPGRPRSCRHPSAPRTPLRRPLPRAAPEPSLRRSRRRARPRREPHRQLRRTSRRRGIAARHDSQGRLRGPGAPPRHAVTDIGRFEGNITLPDDPYLSPRHARIQKRGDRHYLRDLGSVNGIFYRIREPVELCTATYCSWGSRCCASRCSPMVRSRSAR
jgi:hypothetical protein